MKRILLAMLVLVAFEKVNAQKFIVNDRDAELRTVGSFTGIKASSAMDIYISQGDETGVAVSGTDQKVKDRIKTEVKDGVLNIWFDGKGWTDWRGNKQMKVYVSVKELHMIKVDGACDVQLMGKLKAHKLNVDCGGASDLSGELACDELEMNLSGASDTRLKGNIGRVSIKLSGASSMKGWDLVTDYGDIDAHGASSINLVVNKEMNLRAGGASDINYKGSGLIREMKSSGASSIKRKD